MERSLQGQEHLHRLWRKQEINSTQGLSVMAGSVTLKSAQCLGVSAQCLGVSDEGDILIINHILFSLSPIVSSGNLTQTPTCLILRIWSQSGPDGKPPLWIPCSSAESRSCPSSSLEGSPSQISERVVIVFWGLGATHPGSECLWDQHL